LIIFDALVPALLNMWHAVEQPLLIEVMAPGQWIDNSPHLYPQSSFAPPQRTSQSGLAPPKHGSHDIRNKGLLDLSIGESSTGGGIMGAHGTQTRHGHCGACQNNVVLL
jgi:hypothetical protein